MATTTESTDWERRRWSSPNRRPLKYSPSVVAHVDMNSITEPHHTHTWILLSEKMTSTYYEVVVHTHITSFPPTISRRKYRRFFLQPCAFHMAYDSVFLSVFSISQLHWLRYSSKWRRPSWHHKRTREREKIPSHIALTFLFSKFSTLFVSVSHPVFMQSGHIGTR